MASSVKDPDDRLDYTLDWSKRLDAGDTITTSEWIVAPGLDVGDGGNGMPAPTTTTTHATVWLAGGSDGSVYDAVNRITTAAGRRMDHTLRLAVRQQ